MKINKISTVFFSLAAYQVGIVAHVFLPQAASTIGTICTIVALAVLFTDISKSEESKDSINKQNEQQNGE